MGPEMRKPGLFLLFCLCFAACGSRPEVWVHPYLAPLDRQAVPPSAPEKILSLRAAPGEYEPAVFAVRSQRAATLSVRIEDSQGPNALPAGWCGLDRVESLADTTPPNRLYPVSGPVEASPGVTRFFWLTVRPPEDAAPGIYTGHIKVESGSSTQTLEVSCEVLPFHLEESPITGGAFMWLIDLPSGWYRDMKEHGLDAIQFFTWEWGIRPMEHDRSAWPWDPEPIKIENHGGRIGLDFTAFDRIMGSLDSAGMRGPVVISLGNDHHLFYECRIAEKFGLPVDTSEAVDGKGMIAPALSPRLDSLFVDGLRQLRDHWREKAFPQELVILIYDEPTERLLERCKNRYDLIKQSLPEVRVYGVVMNRRDWARSMLDQCDIIVSNGDFTGCMELAQQNGKGFWVYSFPLEAVHTSRFDMGCLPWRVNAQGAFFWMYNYWFYDPDNCVVYMDSADPNRLVRSIAWEGIREGMDDLRYFATAEKLAGAAQADRQEAARERLEAIRSSIDPSRRRAVAGGEGRDEASVLKYYGEPQRVRDEVIRLILDLSR
jgi:hypothetical protein